MRRYLIPISLLVVLLAGSVTATVIRYPHFFGIVFDPASLTNCPAGKNCIATDSADSKLKIVTASGGTVATFSDGAVNLGGNTTVASGKTFTTGSGAASFDGAGKLTFPSTTGTNSQSTVTLSGPGGYRPIAFNWSGGGQSYWEDTAKWQHVNTGTDVSVNLFGSSQAFVVTGANTGFNKLRVEAPASQTVSVFAVKGGTTPGASAHLLDLQDSTGASLWLVNNAGIPEWATASNIQTTVGAAGGASALPATPAKYLKVKDSGGSTFIIPCYNP